ncbi:MAG TPA: MATE family efflux transporter [Caulobacteraceae bacterium]|nr:MATE family efflux transporter [Caulobacteraceae bacterium]
MRDLTKGPITGHLLAMAGFIATGLVVQTLYFLVDLWVVARLGSAAVAGVSAAGTAWMLGMAATQVIAIGTMSLVGRAIGAKEANEAQRVFGQSLSLSVAVGAAALVLGYALGPIGLRGLAADPQTAEAARGYLFAYLPSIAMMFPMAAIGSGLRASGVVGPPMVIQSLALVLNAMLAPVLALGWGTGVPLGTAGAGLATTAATVAGLAALVLLLPRMRTPLRLRVPELRPLPAVWGRIAAIGGPAGAEFVLMFATMSVVYWVIRDFGATAQAGFGVGARVMQSIFLPAMAIAFAAAPIAAQNFGARDPHRVRATFRQAALIGSAVMLTLSVLCHVRPDLLIAPFTSDAAAAEVAVEYLQILSWNFVAVGLVFACGGMFQALGDTRPALVGSAARLVVFAGPVIWLSGRPGFTLQQVWLVSAASGLLQAAISLWLLRVQFRRKLTSLAPVA